MEAQCIADRAALRCLTRQHPEWTHGQLAACIGRSPSFVKKWLKRLREADPDDLPVLFSRSRARHTPPPAPDPRIVERIITIRASPPENLQRTPGPRAILYYLHRDPELQSQGIVPPRSTRTIWKILRQQGCILDPPERTHKPLEPREPLQEVQMDWHRMPPPSPLIQKVSNSMSSRCSILSMLAPPLCEVANPMMIFMRKPLWKPLSPSCVPLVSLPC